MKFSISYQQVSWLNGGGGGSLGGLKHEKHTAGELKPDREETQGTSISDIQFLSLQNLINKCGCNGCMHACMCVYVGVYVGVCAWVCAWVHGCMHLCVCVCVCTWVHACMRVYVCA